MSEPLLWVAALILGMLFYVAQLRLFKIAKLLQRIAENQEASDRPRLTVYKVTGSGLPGQGSGVPKEKT